MSHNYDDILARELGKITKEAAGPVADMFGATVPPLELAGSLGAKMTMRFMPTECCAEILAVRADQVTVLTKCIMAIQDLGTMLDEPSESSFPTLSVVVRSGFLNMNPAVVHIEVVDVQESACKLQVSAAAKEGLIKQNTARKAVCQVVDRLRHRLPIEGR